MTTIEPAPLIDVVLGRPRWDAAKGAEATVRRALTEAAVTIGADFKDRVVAVLLTDDASIRRLNAQWRHIGQTTNVLWFPPASGQPAVGTLFGDVAIAYKPPARKATDEGKPFANHLAHLAV